jgi:RNA polymerase sigma-70 factor (ECF subfamily)
MSGFVTLFEERAVWLTPIEFGLWVKRSGSFSNVSAGLMNEAQDNVSAEFLSRMASRDSSALRRAYDEFGRTVYAVAFRVVGQSTDAEEAVQDAFRALWSNAASLQIRGAKVLPWLITTARRAAIDILRKRKSRIPNAAVISEEVIDMANHVATDEPTAGEVLQQKEVALKVAEVVSSLPDEQRQVVRMVFYSGLTHQEVSDQLGLPLGTVKSRLRYGLQKLQLKIGEVTNV